MGMELFRKIRELLGVTKYRMAKSLGVSPTHYEHFESAGKRVTLLQLVKLKELSGLPVTKFWELLEEEVGAQTIKRKKRDGTQ